MFRALAKDLSGTADICNTVSASNLSKTLAAAYLLPSETILFAFASAKEEFAFTNEALITVRGENATTTRKLVLRYEYRDHALSNVHFETTGRVDRDCEIKFTIGEFHVSIDIAKKEEELVKGHYKALVALSREQQRRFRSWHFAQLALDKTSDAMKMSGHADPEALSLTNQASGALGWLESDFARLNPRDYHGVIQSSVAGIGSAQESERSRHRRSVA
ncbi:P-loop containing nucleoside triphosphate hydrolase [Globisporangium polare]